MEILITGATGYMARRLIPVLLARGHRVRAFARPGSLERVPPGAEAIAGDALSAMSVAAALKPGDTVIHLVGTPHPSPAKAKEFQRVDLSSIRATVEAATRGGAGHFIYVSVAQPAPVMRAYLAVRAQGETLIREAKLTATILRPWYVLGPGHWWPLAAMPLYKILELFPVTRDGAYRLGLVTLGQMIKALVYAVENPPHRGAQSVLDVPAIRVATVDMGR